MIRNVFLWAAAIVVLVLLVGGFALNAWVRGWLRGPEFRGLVEQNVGRTLGGEAQFQPFIWTGSSIFSPQLQVQGEVGRPIESLDARQIRADVNWRAAFSGVWQVNRIDVTRLDMAFQAPVPAAPTAVEIPVAGGSAVSSGSKRGWLPTRFQLDEVFVQDANVRFSRFGEIKNSVLRAKPDGAGWIFEASGGKLGLEAAAVPLELDAVRVRLQQGVVYLTQADFRSSGSGRITANGELGGSEKPYDVRIEWSGVDSKDVLDATWREKLHGLLAGNAHVTASLDGGAKAVGSFRLGDGSLRGLPLQDEIATFTRSPQFQRMPIHELSADFTSERGTTDFTNFVLESKGLLKMMGSGRLDPQDRISGIFQIGVTQQTLQWLPGSQEKVFTTARDGYLWTEVRIGGTIDLPTEDLSPRLARALGEKVIETGVQILEGSPEKTRDAVNQVIDILSPLIR